MKRASALLAAAAVAATTTTASAGTPLLPPAEYDHPYAGQIELVQLPQKQVHRECSKSIRNLRHDVNGCAFVVADDVCLITMVSHRTSRVRDLEDLFRHERAHCNGWRHE